MRERKRGGFAGSGRDRRATRSSIDQPFNAHGTPVLFRISSYCVTLSAYAGLNTETWAATFSLPSSFQTSRNQIVSLYIVQMTTNDIHGTQWVLMTRKRSLLRFQAEGFLFYQTPSARPRDLDHHFEVVARRRHEPCEILSSRRLQQTV